MLVGSSQLTKALAELVKSLNYSWFFMIGLPCRALVSPNATLLTMFPCVTAVHVMDLWLDITVSVTLFAIVCLIKTFKAQ